MPVNLDQIGSLFALSAFILLVSYEFIIPYIGRNLILVNKERMRRATFVMGILFVFTVVIKILQILSI
jgi:hypothetical protein